MTIAIALKVEDGLVLAADSASTLMAGDGEVWNIYNNADKIVNLYKGLPIGLLFWGAGSIGSVSMTTLAKDLRVRLTGPEEPWSVDPEHYTVEEVAEKARLFFFDERYTAAFGDLEPEDKPKLGLFVAGYGSGQGMSECYEVVVGPGGVCVGPTAVSPAEDEAGLMWRGEPEAIMRLILGFGSGVSAALREMGVKDEVMGRVVDVLRDHLEVSLVEPAMPIQDAIDLGAFLVELTKQWSRFIPGAQTVGGPTELAVITKHEGFKWVRRKHYYDAELNPVRTHV